MIKINSRSDPRISQTFPNDPHSNLCIVTASQRLHLQHAFLSMDSEYFSKIDPDAREIDLRQLKQQPLIRVIHSLYGQPLEVRSLGELAEIYPIIVYLEIEDFRLNVEAEVKSKREIKENVEFIELSYRYKILFPEVLEIHLANKLKFLEDSRSYLQLNKLSDQTFNFLISQFTNRYGETECKVLNNVMENYFNRKNLKPMAYFKQYGLTKLQTVWMKYHHVPTSELMKIKSSPVLTSPDYENSRSRKTTEAFLKRKGEERDSKQRKVIELEREIFTKDHLINDLQSQVDALKRQLGIKNEPSKPITSRSLIAGIDNYLPNLNMRKDKRFTQISPQAQSDNDTTITQQNFPKQSHIQINLYQPKPCHTPKRLSSSQAKEVKILNRFGSKNLKRY